MSNLDKVMNSNGSKPTIENEGKKTAWVGEFKTLAYNQALMTRLGLSSHRLTEPTNEFFKSFMPYFNLSFLAINLILCGVLMFWNWPVLDLILEPLLIIIAGVQSGGMFLGVGLKMKHVKVLNLNIQKIVDDEGNHWIFNNLFQNEFSPKSFIHSIDSSLF